jgi:hypothetical protein
MSATTIVEGILVQEAEERFGGSAMRLLRPGFRFLAFLLMAGLQLNVTLQTENLFDARHARYLTLSEIGLTPWNPASISLAYSWINTHFAAIHHNTPFLHLQLIIDIANRELNPSFQQLQQPNSIPENGSLDPRLGHVGLVGNDERALLYAVLALGCLREETYDPQTGSYHDIPTSGTPDSSSTGSQAPFAGINESVNISASLYAPALAHKGQSLFRLAQEELDQLEKPSEIAVQALFLLHTFVSNTSMSRKSRDYVARAIMMAHEIGLNRNIPPLVRTKGGPNQIHMTRRRAILYLYVYFSDV